MITIFSYDTIRFRWRCCYCWRWLYGYPTTSIPLFQRLPPPAMYLVGSVGTIGLGLWVIRNFGAADEATEEEAETQE